MNPNTPISNIMTQAPVTVRPDDNLVTVQDIFNRYPFHHIPVLEKDNSVVGIISKTDMLLFLKNLSHQTSGKKYTQFSETNTMAIDIMTTDLTALDPEDTVGLAADIFLANIFHAVPVVEDNKLVGILTNHDLLQYAYKGVIANETP